ncbi:MAG TPA: DUF2950 domain-containing protein [Patescibacteria group bacterium]|nr:DUF2950 domain-containing protein [Patescibacteria group bacterium]
MIHANIRRQALAGRALPLLFASLLLVPLSAGVAVLRAAPPPGAAGAQTVPSAQPTFSTPEDALQALIAAAKKDDPRVVSKLFGPDGKHLLSGDRVQDRDQLERFAANLETSAQLQKEAAGYTILVGQAHWAFPIPLVSQGDRWMFDTKAGLQEILDRRIGQDELAAIATCRAYAVAQWEYYTESGGDTQGLAVYAQKFISSPGHHNGLYWETAEGEKPSPLGSLVADARAEGYGRRNSPARSSAEPRRPRPFHGYYFKILTAQGPSAPGGKFSYIINGNMIAGYALIAYPAKWGDSGVMTFIINNQGRVYQKNLGPETSTIAPEITEYNPDPTWQLVQQSVN